ncbi:MAG: tandem-95 repeat protein [Bacteroidota bacterium]
MFTENPLNGTVTDNNDGIITYTPNQTFNGLDTLTYQVCDDGIPALCDTARVIIIIGSVNNAPIAMDDTEQTNEDAPITINALLNAVDIDGDLNGDSIRLIVNPINGFVVDNGDSTLTYTPNPNFAGLDSLQYEICDTSATGSLCDIAWVLITVNSVNDAPIVVNDTTNTQCQQ